MKRSQSNTVELSLQDIVDKFKLGKNVSNLEVSTMVNGASTVMVAGTVIVLSFETVKAEKKKGGGRPRKSTKGADATNGATAPASA